MFKNVASQKLTVFVFDYSTGAPKTGDAANLTCYVSKDDGAVTVLGDTSATELDNTNAKGSYSFDLTQAETNADKLVFTGKSATGNVAIVAQTIYTVPPNFTHQAMLRTTIATLSSQSNFTLTAGSADDDAYNGCVIVFEDQSTIAQKSVRYVFDYVGSTKSLTLSADPAFTIAVGDIVTILADRSLKSLTDGLNLAIGAVGSVKVSGDAFGNLIATQDSVDAIPTNLLNFADGVETGVTLRQAQRVQLAAAAGKTDGFVAGTAGTGHLRNTSDTKNRITATYDANGNRTVVVLDLT